MYQPIKKLSIIATIIIILTTALSSTGFAFNNENRNISPSVINKVTLYRHGLDGSITPVTVDLNVDEGMDIGEIINEKCSELLENDIEMQNFISSKGILSNITNISVWAHIKSWGVGVHWKSLVRFRIPLFTLLRFRLFEDVPLRYKIFGINVISWIHCNYMNDDDAKTTIETLPLPVRPGTRKMTIEGKHNITTLFFFGYTFWPRAQATWFDEQGLATGFDGYAFFTLITRPTS